MPVTVPPAKTTSDAPGSTVPAVYVQLLAVRSVPDEGQRSGRLVDVDHRQVARDGRGRAR